MHSPFNRECTLTQYIGQGGLRLLYNQLKNGTNSLMVNNLQSFSSISSPSHAGCNRFMTFMTECDKRPVEIEFFVEEPIIDNVMNFQPINRPTSLTAVAVTLEYNKTLQLPFRRPNVAQIADIHKNPKPCMALTRRGA